MAVRNFWIEADIDGKAVPLRGGPRAKDGGFYLTVKMRDQGRITLPVTVWGAPDRDGNLRLGIRVQGADHHEQADGVHELTVETRR